MPLALAAAIAVAAATPYATPERAMTEAIQDAVELPKEVRLLCTGGAEPGERGRCFGTFLSGDRLYDLGPKSRIKRVDRRTVTATLSATVRGGKRRVEGE